MDINYINLFYLTIIAVTALLGNLINFAEPYLPVIVIQTIRFGKHSYSGPKNFLVRLLEVPKSWYKHFYVFALVWSLLGLVLSVCSAADLAPVPENVLVFFDVVGGVKSRPVQVASTAGLLAMVLLTLQCVRRFYETQFVQVFSKKGKLNIGQYFVGVLHYFGAVVAILMNCEGFVRGSRPSGLDLTSLTPLEISCSLLFLFCWVYQFKCNLILADLRKDRTGKVKTEKHLLPVGGFFEYVSSPHMLFEVLMYVALLGIIPSSVTWRYCTLWVVLNQSQTAWLTHQWYKEHFKNYPKRRKAIYPFLL